MALEDILFQWATGMIEWIFKAFNVALGGIIEGILDFLTSVITRTPYPEQCPESAVDAGVCDTENTAPRVFGEPRGMLWSSLHTIYTGSAQPYAYVLWMFALVAVQFSSIFDGLIPSVNTEKSKKKLMVAFLGITLWWPAGVMILGFSDALGTVLLTLGVPGATENSDSIGLAATYDVVMANLESSDNIYGLWITFILWIIEFLLLGILAVLWFIRIALIYIMMPLMPIFIAIWALELPGLDPLQQFAETSMEAFTTLAFITIPGALIVGFFGTIINVAAQFTNTHVDGADIQTTGSDIDADIDDYSQDGTESTGGSGGENSFVEPTQSATSDPVGSLSETFSPNPETTSRALDASMQAQQAQPMPDAGDFATNMIASLIFALIVMSLPVLAGLAPILIAKSLPGAEEAMGAAGFLANPAGAAMGAAGSVASTASDAAGKVDRGTALGNLAKDGIKGGISGGYNADGDVDKDGRTKIMEEMGWAESSGPTKGFNMSDRGTSIKDDIDTAMSAEGVALGAGAAVHGGKNAMSDGKDLAGDAADQVADGASRAKQSAIATGASMGRTGLDSLANPGQMGRIQARNALRVGDKVIGNRVPSYQDAEERGLTGDQDGMGTRAMSAVSGRKDRAVGQFNQRVEGAMETMHTVQTAVNQEYRVSKAKDEYMLRAEHESDPAERRMSEEQQAMLDEHGWLADSHNEYARSMESRTKPPQGFPDSIEFKTPDDITDDMLQEEFEVDVAAMGDVDKRREELAEKQNEKLVEEFEEKLDSEEVIKKIASDRAGTDALYAEDLELSVLQGMEAFTEGDWNVKDEAQDRSPGEDPYDSPSKASGSSSTPSQETDREIATERMLGDLLAGETVRR